MFNIVITHLFIPRGMHFKNLPPHLRIVQLFHDSDPNGETKNLLEITGPETDLKKSLSDELALVLH